MFGRSMYLIFLIINIIIMVRCCRWPMSSSISELQFAFLSLFTALFFLSSSSSFFHFIYLLINRFMCAQMCILCETNAKWIKKKKKKAHRLHLVRCFFGRFCWIYIRFSLFTQWCVNMHTCKRAGVHQQFAHPCVRLLFHSVCARALSPIFRCKSIVEDHAKINKIPWNCAALQWHTEIISKQPSSLRTICVRNEECCGNESSNARWLKRKKEKKPPTEFAWQMSRERTSFYL